MLKFTKLIILLVFLSLECGCGSGGAKNEPSASALPNGSVADYELLFIGNSHSSANNLPELVTILIETGEPNKTARSDLAPGWRFLDERLNDGVTQAYLKSKAWSHVFLQAQKYSSSGLYYYSTDAAEEWVRKVKTENATPILFPEWPRRGNNEEGLRVYNLHLSIAANEPACVAPVGLVWDEFIRLYPNIPLHASDGNHSNLTGALLTAYIFYQVITSKSANELPYISSINIDKNTQVKLRETASLFTGMHLPCP